MGIRDTVARALPGGFFLPAPASNGSTVEAKALPPSEIQAKGLVIAPEIFWPNGMVDFTRTEENVTRWTAYAATALAYICIRKRFTKLAEAPPMVVEERDEGDKWLDTHALNPLLAKPNPDYLFRALYQLTSIYRDITGHVIWVKVRNRGKRVAELRAFSGDHFTIQPTRTREFGRFQVNAQSGSFALEPEDVIYFPGFDPWVPQEAVSPVDAALGVLGIGASLQQAAKAALKNSIFPSGAISVPDDLGEHEFNFLKGKLDQTYQGSKKAGLPLLMPSGATWMTVQWSLKELMPADLVSYIEATVCAVFELHPSMLGLKTGIENSPWSQLKQAQRMLYDEMAIPRWTADAEVLTESLLREIDPAQNHLIRFDTSDIPVLQEDQKEKAEILAKIQHSMRIDEQRQFMGLEPFGDDFGNSRWVASSMLPADLMMEAGVPRTPREEPPTDDDEPEPEE